MADGLPPVVTVPKPAGLDVAGAALWDSLIETYVFRVDELVMVAELAHLADDLARLREELADAPLTVAGSKGQQVAHPLRLELHRTSARYESIAKTLGIPDEDGSSAVDKSHAGRRLARARWG